MDDYIIVTQHPDMLIYIDALQRSNAEQLAFVPIKRLAYEVSAGNVFLALLNAMPCGYLYFGTRQDQISVHQACIQYDARRRLYGAMLITALEDHALAHGVKTISLRCGFENDANYFWSSLGYKTIAIQPGGVRRMRQINVWRKNLAPTLFEDAVLEPAKGKTDASIWRKHKQTGLITQFHRGNQLLDYRAQLINSNEQG